MPGRATWHRRQLATRMDRLDVVLLGRLSITAWVLGEQRQIAGPALMITGMPLGDA
jgi:hypothetical protein